MRRFAIFYSAHCTADANACDLRRRRKPAPNPTLAFAGVAALLALAALGFALHSRTSASSALRARDALSKELDSLRSEFNGLKVGESAGFGGAWTRWDRVARRGSALALGAAVVRGMCWVPGQRSSSTGPGTGHRAQGRGQGLKANGSTS